MESWVHPSASIGEGTSLGPFSVVHADCEIGERCVIGAHVVIHRGTKVGSQVRVDDHAVLGKLPMRGAISIMAEEAELEPARIGDRCIIGTSVVIYRGADLGAKVLVADLATVREHVTVGEGTIIGRGVTIENYCRVGRFCKLETESYITAYSELGDRVFIAPQVSTSNDNFVGRTEERFKHFKGVTVETGGRIGTAAVILPGKRIGADGLVAAGSVVTRDVPARKIVVGSPARVMRDVPREQLLEEQGWEDQVKTRRTK